ncbi:MAG: helix-turn-helix domain-containing protein [Acidimicrobiales bacterium]
MAAGDIATPRATARVARGQARGRLLDAAVDVIRARGLSATSVDDLCAAAGVTKGAFFHHFESKEALAVAAAQHWGATTGAMFAAASYHQGATAAERVLAYVDLRAESMQGPPLAAISCLAGTMVQEAYGTSPAVRDACGATILDHARTLEADLAEALADAGNPPGVDAPSLARHMVAVVQGAFVVAKAADDPSVAVESLVHLRRYLALLFGA